MIQRHDTEPCTATLAGITCDRRDGHDGSHRGHNKHHRIAWTTLADQTGTSSRYTPVPPAPAAPPGRTDPAKITAPTPDAVRDTRRARDELDTILTILDTVIADYEHAAASDGWRPTIPGIGDHDRTESDPIPTTPTRTGGPSGPCTETGTINDCPTCGHRHIERCNRERPCPVHDTTVTLTPTERAAHLRASATRQLGEINRRAAKLSYNAGELLAYVLSVRAKVNHMPLTDSEKRGLECHQCDELALADPATGRPLVFKLTAGRDQQLCARHRDQELTCDYCDRQAETDNDRVQLRRVDGGLAKLCSTCRKAFSQGAA